MVVTTTNPSSSSYTSEDFLTLAATPSATGKSNNYIGAIAGGSAGGAVALALLAGVGYFLFKGKAGKFGKKSGGYHTPQYGKYDYGKYDYDPSYGVRVDPMSVAHTAGNAGVQTYMDNAGQGGQSSQAGQSSGFEQYQQDPSQLQQYVDNLDPSDLDFDHKRLRMGRPRPARPNSDELQRQPLLPNKFPFPYPPPRGYSATAHQYSQVARPSPPAYQQPDPSGYHQPFEPYEEQYRGYQSYGTRPGTYPWGSQV